VRFISLIFLWYLAIYLAIEILRRDTITICYVGLWHRLYFPLSYPPRKQHYYSSCFLCNMCISMRRAGIWRCMFANTEKKVSCSGKSEISSAAKETTLNTLIIAASLQTRPSCVGAVMDTSDHYTDILQRPSRLVRSVEKSSVSSVRLRYRCESHAYYYLIAKPHLAPRAQISRIRRIVRFADRMARIDQIGLEQRERMMKHLRTSSSSNERDEDSATKIS